MSKIGRSAKSGHFTTVKTARNNPDTHVVETIKKLQAPKPPATKKK